MSANSISPLRQRMIEDINAPHALRQRMRSSSPKRTHIFGRAKLNSQTLVVICILFDYC